jgi:hypothetical protein
MVQITIKKTTKKQTIDEGQEIEGLLLKKGYKKVTKEQEQTEEYKNLFERPICFNGSDSS